MAFVEETKRPPILYSCYHTLSREGEHFVPEHVFSYQIAGSLILNDGGKTYQFQEGDFKFVKRNHLLKFTKQPPAGGEFKSLSVYLDQETLQKFSEEYNYTSTQHLQGDAIVEIKPDKLLAGYIESLMPYSNTLQVLNPRLMTVKVTEVIFLLLQTNLSLKNILFDFSDPGKIDLENFMNKNFHFNVQLQRFAYLTGRSLATFKRDFEKIFNQSPNRWLQQKRLEEAHYLLKEKGKAASDVYLDLGFQDLSHFSFAFKKKYGVSPSKV